MWGDNIKVLKLKRKIDVNTILSLLNKYKILVIVCGKKEYEQQLISLLTKSMEYEKHTDDERNLYQKKIDYIDPERIDSALKVRDFLIFYAMVSQNYNECIFEKQIHEFCKLCKEDIMEKSVNELSRQDKIVVRCMIAYMRKVKILFGKDFLKEVTKEERERLTIFLKKYFVDNSSRCILLEHI